VTSNEPHEFGLTPDDLRLAAGYLYPPLDTRLSSQQFTQDEAVKLGRIRSRLRGLADAMDEDHFAWGLHYIQSSYGHEGMRLTERLRVPGYEGSIGPGPGQYHLPHVYARDIFSGAGNCVCGRDLYASVHTEAAPGVPVPDFDRR